MTELAAAADDCALAMGARPPSVAKTIVAKRFVKVVGKRLRCVALNMKISKIPP
jgi:hypothetical protein